MHIVLNMLKGYFIWSIPFFMLACNNRSTVSAKAADPEDCEWYVVYNDNKTASAKNKLDIYALRLYPNGTYTLCADLLFEQGTWRYDDRKKITVFHPAVKNEAAQERYLVDQVLPGNKTQFSFYHQYPPDKENPDEMIDVRSISNQSTYDPYHPNMHLWRKKPESPESSQQIRSRVLSYLQFLKSLYFHASENDLENAGGTWYPKPIRFYNNKVSMAYANELNDWYNCFYNDAQGIEGYKLISGALMRTAIKGEDDNSRNINCVEQLLQLVGK